MNGRKISIFYLLLYMGFAIWRVFYNVYLEEIHFSGAKIGVINAITQASIVFIVPVWGYVADKNGIRPVLRLTLMATSVLVFFLGEVTTFPVLIFYILFLALFYSSLGPLTDAMAVQFSVTDKRYNYGNLRLWGSLGWALSSVIGGVIFARIDTRYIFPVSACFFFILILFLFASKKRKIIYKPNFQPIDLRSLFRDQKLLAFILILLFYGIACSPVNSYLNLYFKGLHADNGIIGMAYAIQAFSELPFFFIGDRLVKKIGAKRVILFSILVMSFRLLCYGFIPNIPFALGLGVIQGITLSFFLVGAVDYIHQLLPEGRHATALSFIWGIYFGLGQTLGNLIIGVLKDIVGMIGVMAYSGFFVVIVLLSTGYYFYTIRTSQQQKT